MYDIILQMFTVLGNVEIFLQMWNVILKMMRVLICINTNFYHQCSAYLCGLLLFV